MSNMITSGMSGLIAYQRAIDVAAQNIANANTDGYVRQRVELSTQYAPVDLYGSSIGGVKVDGIRREVNQYLIDQSRVARSGAGRAEVMATQAQRITSLLGSTLVGLDDALQSLQIGFEALSVEPSSLRARDALLNDLGSMIDRFKVVDSRLRQFDAEINGRLDDEVTEVNQLLTQLGQLNEKVFRSGITVGISPANVLDERDRLLDKLSAKLGFNVSVEANQTVTVKSIDGRLLVKGSEAARLSVEDGLYDAAESRIFLSAVGSATPADFTNGLAGGSLGGLIDARAQLTSTTRNEAGRIAVGLVAALNAQHQAGRDLGGVLGGSLLAVGAPQTFASSTNSSGSVGVALAVQVSVPPASLTAADFVISRTATGWQVSQADTGVVVPHSGNGTAGSPLQFGGLSVVVGGTGTVATGDSFLVQATRSAIGGLERSFSDPKLLAAARSDLPFGASDNENALKLSQALTTGYLDSGKTSLLDAASRLSSRVGSQARSAQLALDVQNLAVEETTRQRSDLYGVSLDEEAANLMRFQQAYQASAAVIRVANELFDELLGATR